MGSLARVDHFIGEAEERGQARGEFRVVLRDDRQGDRFPGAAPIPRPIAVAAPAERRRKCRPHPACCTAQDFIACSSSWSERRRRASFRPGVVALCAGC